MWRNRSRGADGVQDCILHAISPDLRTIYVCETYGGWLFLYVSSPDLSDIAYCSSAHVNFQISSSRLEVEGTNVQFPKQSWLRFVQPIRQ